MFELHPEVTEDGLPTSGGDAMSRGHRLDTDDNRRLHRILLGHCARELDRQIKNRHEMVKDEQFYDHHQWTPNDEAILRERGQEPLTFNVIFTTINWLIGVQRRQRSQHRILARRKDGVQAAELKTKYLKYLSDVNNSHFQVSAAYAEAVKAGISFLETGISYDGDGELIHENKVSWRDVLWDSQARRDDLSDSRYFMRLRWVDLDRAIKMYPDREAILRMSAESAAGLGGLMDGIGDFASDVREGGGISSLGYGGSLANEHIANFPMYDGTGIGEIGSGYRPRVRLIECWYRTPERAEFINGGEFDRELYDPASIGHLIALKSGEATLSERQAELINVCMMCRSGLLHQTRSPYRHNRFPFTPIWAFRDSDTGLPYGVIRGLRDPQQDINKRASKLLYLMSSMRVMLEEGAVDDVEILRDEVTRPDAVIEYKVGRQPPKIERDLDVASQNWGLIDFNRQMLENIAGVNKDNLGLQTDKGKSGRAIVAHQEQGSLSTQILTDNLSRGYQGHGQKVLSLVEQYVSDERSVRVTGDRGVSYTSVNASEDMSDNLTTTKADFIVAEDMFSDTLRQQSADKLFELLQKLAATSPEIVMSILDLLVDSMDIPNHDVIVDRIRQITGQEDPDKDPDAPPTPEEQAKMEAEARAQQLAERMQESEVALSESKAQREAAQAEKLEVEIREKLTGFGKAQLEMLASAIQSAQTLMETPEAGPAADELMLEADARSAERGGR